MSKKDFKKRASKKPLGDILSKPMKKAVDKEIKQYLAKEVEVKTSDYDPVAVNLVKVGTANWSNTCVYSLGPCNANGPVIAQGPGQGERIGNKIRTKKAIVRFHLNAGPYDTIANAVPVPQYISVRIWKDKLAIASLFPTGLTTLAEFLQDANGTQPLSGNMGDVVYNVNKDRYEVYWEKIYKIGYSGNAGSGSDSTQGFFSNNDFAFSKFVRLDVTKFLPKTIQFEDANTTPYSPGIYISFDSINSNGSASVANTWDANLIISQEFTYTDL